MRTDEVKLPNPEAIKELRERYDRRKRERLKRYPEFVETLRKRIPLRKIAKQCSADAEL